MSESVNYEAATVSDDSWNFEIVRAGITPKVTITGWTYGQEANAPSVSNNPGGGTVTYYYNTTNSNTGGTEWKNITGTTLNSGTYYLYATVAESTNYNAATTATTEFTISAATKPDNPDPVNLDPVNPDPVNPDPVNPDPVNPDPDNPDPDNPGKDDPDELTEEQKKAAESLTPRLDPTGEAVTSLITALFDDVDDVEIVVLSLDNATISGDRSPEDLITVLSPEQLANISSDHSVILAVLPEITPKVTAVFVLGFECNETLKGLLKWFGFPKPAGNKVALAADEEEKCVFLSDSGQEITSVPEGSGHVNVAVKLTKDMTYAPVITAETSTAPTSNKDGGGCEVGFAGVTGLLALTGLMARKRK